jgi:hypothetical protein
MHHLHAYPDLRAMFRRLLIAALIGVLLRWPSQDFVMPCCFSNGCF